MGDRRRGARNGHDRRYPGPCRVRLYLKAHRAASSLRIKGGWPSNRPHQEAGIPSSTHSATRTAGLLSSSMTTGQSTHYTGLTALLDDVPKAQLLFGDRGYEAGWSRDPLQVKGTSPAFQPVISQRDGQIRQAALSATKAHWDHVRSSPGNGAPSQPATVVALPPPFSRSPSLAPSSLSMINDV